jgi:N-methylhydantoinase A
VIRIGIDIGGTFTDFAIWSGAEDGYVAIESFKVPSSPPDFAEAVKTGLEQLIEDGRVAPDETILLVHGTTVSTNAVIERSGPPLALLTTRGFKDLLNIQRLRLHRPVDMYSRRAEPLIPREHVFEIDERMLADGSVDRPLDAAAVEMAGKAIAATGVRAIAVSFMHAYRNDRHEREAKAIIEGTAPSLDVSVSSDVWPQQGEYERTVVTTLNAYVKETIGSYLAEIERFLAQRLPGARLFITRSNGGVMSAGEARGYPVHTLLSGPASGVTAARFVGDMLSLPGILTMDMGGTSTDMSLVVNGQAQVSTEAEVGDFPLMMPVTAIEAIGAGGGSIAWMDGPVLKVGPRSAGATPGPACYGQGGTEPTLVLCGYLNPAYFLGGRMPLDRDRAEAAVQPLADAMGVDLTEAAEACVTVGTSNMLTKVLPFLARLGVSPRELTLVLYGGAGAVHGPLLADEVGIGSVLVPRSPSVFCAFGGLVSELVHDVVSTVQGLDVDAESMQRTYAALGEEANDWLAAQVDGSWLQASTVEYSAEMRYRGQSFQVNVPLSPEIVEAGDLAAIIEAFHVEHERLYTHCDRATGVEFIELRARLRAAMVTPRPVKAPPPAGRVEAAMLETRRVRFRGAWHETVPVYRRDGLGPGHVVPGPAIVEQSDATVVVPPGYTASVGVYGDLALHAEP